MSKNKAIIAATMMVMLVTGGIAGAVPSGPFGYDLQKDMHRSENKAKEQQSQTQVQTQQNTSSTNVAVPVNPTDAKSFYNFVSIKDLYVQSVDNKVYYPDATMNSAIALYKQGNYTQCLQHLYSYIKKQPNDAYAYYYMGLAYTKIGENNAAKNCYQKVINCNAQGKLLLQALKGRDCITGGAYCHAFDPSTVSVPSNTSTDPLDVFINAPYQGNGFSPELEKEYKQKELENIQKEINRKDVLNPEVIEKIQKLENKSEGLNTDKSALVSGFAANLDAEPSKAEVLEAIDVLKRAGLNISVNSDDKTTASSQQKFNPADFMPSPEMQQLNMMLGNNNNNNDPMMNMLPFMMNAENNGQKIDPQVIQAMMVNSMMGSINSMGNTDNK